MHELNLYPIISCVLDIGAQECLKIPVNRFKIQGSLTVEYIGAISCVAMCIFLYVCFVSSGERVLCFHGPLLYEAKVCSNANALCVCY